MVVINLQLIFYLFKNNFNIVASQDTTLHPKEGGEKTEVAPGGGDQSAS